MLGLKIVKSASLGQPAEWEDEGEAGDPAEAVADLALSPRRVLSSASLAQRDHGEAGAVRVGEDREAADGDVDRADITLPPRAFAVATAASVSSTPK